MRDCNRVFMYVVGFGILAGIVLRPLQAVAPDDEQSGIRRIAHGPIPESLTDQLGDAERGRGVVLDRDKGDCIVCHAMPLPQHEFHGTVGPPLDGIGNRSTASALRRRLIDPKVFNPQTVMPSYYRTEGLHRVLGRHRGKPILTAQEIEDVVAYLLTLNWIGSRSARAEDLAPYIVEDRRSGYTYLSEDNQRLQTDEFANPGLLWVEHGRELWEQSDGAARKSCASCHADAPTSMRGVRTRYPRFDTRSNKLMNLEQQINRCRVERMQAQVFPYESEALLALTTFVGFQSRGLPMNVRIDGPARPFFEAGHAFFTQRRGQLDLACSHCHDQYAGQWLRGEMISQGQSNGFPIYRHTWQTLGSTHRMFSWCNVSIRAEPFLYDADEYVNLELYMAWRARSLPVETPAIRR